MFSIQSFNGKLSVEKLAEYLIKSVEMDPRRDGRYFMAMDELVSMPARWSGQLAEQFGLGIIQDKELEMARFQRLFAGQDPNTGEQLVRVDAKTHDPGRELGLAIPKSFSVAWARGDELTRIKLDQILLSATETLMTQLESELNVIRRGRDDDGHQRYERGKWIYGLFPHSTSRLTEESEKLGRPQDPQCHFHIPLPSLTQAEDGSWHAFETFEVFSNQIEIDARWQALVVKQVREKVGMAVVSEFELAEREWRLRWERDEVRYAQHAGVKPMEFALWRADTERREGKREEKAREFYIEGFINPEMLRRYSTRSEQVERNKQDAVLELLMIKGSLTEAELKQLDDAGRRELTQETLKTMDPKLVQELIQAARLKNRMAKRSVPSDVFAFWAAELERDFGVTLETLTAAMNQPAKPEPSLREVMDEVVRRLPQTDSTVKWTQLRGLVAETALKMGCWSGVDELTRKVREAERGETELTPAQILHELHPNLVLADEQGKRVTTDVWLQTERDVLAQIRRLRDTSVACPTAKLALEPVARPILQGIADATGKEVALSRDQVKLLEKVLTRRVNIIVGESGTGKGVTAGIVTKAWKEATGGGQVLALAVAGDRALHFGLELGGAKSYTFEALRLAHQQDQLKLDDRTLIIIDEGAMVDTERMGYITQVLKAHSNVTPALLCIGDPEQIKGIGATGLYEEAAVMTGHLPKLTKVTRTKDRAFAAMQKHIRRGKGIAKALNYFDEKGLVHLVDDKDALKERVIELWGDRWQENGMESKGLRDMAMISADGSLRLIDDLAVGAQTQRLIANELDAHNFVEVERVDPQRKTYSRRQRFFAPKVEIDSKGEEITHHGDLLRVTGSIWTKDSRGKRVELLGDRISGDGKMLNGQNVELVQIHRDEQTKGVTGLEVARLGRKNEATILVTKPEDWAKMTLGYARSTMGDQGSTRNEHIACYSEVTEKTSFYVGSTRATKPGPIVIAKDSLDVNAAAMELQPEKAKETYFKAFTTQLQGPGAKKSALSAQPGYQGWRKKSERKQATIQAQRDAERMADIELEEEQERLMEQARQSYVAEKQAAMYADRAA